MLTLNGRSFGRSDVHPLAVIETENPISECMTCSMPVPMDSEYDVYCDSTCQDVHLNEAIHSDASIQCSCCK
jgi:hypothetical protein